jgi:hypothetical protein
MAVARRHSLELIVFLYFLSYLPNIVVTRLVTTTPDAGLGRPLTGLETLPASLIVSLVLTYAFIWVSRWYRDAHKVNVAGLSLPIPTWYTFLSGVGTSLVLFTVPLSLTFPRVSIPFIQLLMRRDILIIAPLVDLLFGRRRRRSGPRRLWREGPRPRLEGGAIQLVSHQAVAPLSRRRPLRAAHAARRARLYRPVRSDADGDRRELCGIAALSIGRASPHFAGGEHADRLPEAGLHSASSPIPPACPAWMDLSRAPSHAARLSA